MTDDCGFCTPFTCIIYDATKDVPGAIPAQEMDDVPTAPQCQGCLRPVRECAGKTKKCRERRS